MWRRASEAMHSGADLFPAADAIAALLGAPDTVEARAGALLLADAIRTLRMPRG